MALHPDPEVTDLDDDTWFVVKKQNEPTPPAAPPILKAWIAPDSGRDAATPPRLLNRIIVPKPSRSGNAASDKSAEKVASTLEYEVLDDHPEVTTALAAFMTKEWTPWATKHAQWAAFQERVYSPLFAIYRDLARLGEEFELVLGVGCLSWRTPTGQDVRRHIVTAQVTLEFDPAAGSFTLRPAPEGAKLGVEVDMLDPSDQPSGPQRDSIDEDIRRAADDPWDFAVIDRALRAFTHAISKDGAYDPTAYEAGGLKREPNTAFAPALLLRRRTSRGVLLAMQEVIRQLQGGASIPPGVTRLTRAAVSNAAETDTKETTASNSPPEAKYTYFPLDANDDQRQIVARLNARDGVLVQGPPGTGKSHTIANLICHLLATGQRVLITAQTPRALQVLREKLPKEVQPLCLSVLGNDKAAQDNVEHSVRHITDMADSWDQAQLSESIAESERKLDALLRQEAQLERDVRTHREAEVHTHTVGEGAYVGTAQSIAQQVREKAAAFTWFEDKPEVNAHFPCDPDTIIEFRRELMQWPDSRVQVARLVRPALGELLPPLERVYQSLATWHEYRRIATTPTKTPVDLSHVSTQELLRVRKALESLQERLGMVSPAIASWEVSARKDILRGAHAGWDSLLTRTRERLSAIEPLAAGLVGRSVSVPSDVPEDVLRADAADLAAHLDAGGGWGLGIFRAKVVKRTIYLRSRVTVDGRPADNAPALKSVVQWIDLRAHLGSAWTAWQGKAAPSSPDISLQCDALSDLCARLEGALSLRAPTEEAMRAVALLRLTTAPLLGDAATVRALLAACQTESARRHERTLASEIDAWASGVRAVATDACMHPVCGKFATALESRDATALRSALAELESLEKEKAALAEMEERKRVILRQLPKTGRALVAAPHDPEWDHRLPRLRAAWRWAQADTWLTTFTDPRRAAVAEADLQETQKRIKSCLAKASSERAWLSCLSSMSDKKRDHLHGWRNANRKITKSGKRNRDSYFRSVAQSELNNCRDVIPAWVMPLYKVFEAVSPSPGVFDVVVVDEASQCGPESLFLFFLAKKLVIVGDDEQISPSNVGLNRDEALMLLKNQLSEIEQAHLFDVDNSLFEHGKRLGMVVTLREHFRCMPEIIRFSNDLCYRGELVPLRQYPTPRLAPYVARFISYGETQGGSDKKTNLAEAEAIVNTIVTCCADPMYEDKTIGVISLLGEAQAKLIDKLLVKRLGAEEIERRRIVCGDAYAFQGDERHIVFLSLVVANHDAEDRRFASLTGSTYKQRFNVAASRAQDQLWLFHSVMPEDVGNPDCMRHKLLTYFYDPARHAAQSMGIDVDDLRRKAAAQNRPPTAPVPFDSWFEVDVYLRIIARGYRVLPQYKAGRKRIDLVVEGRTRLAIECDGDRFHTDENFEQDMARQRQLERAQWQFWRVRGSAFYRDPDAALASLWDRLSELGIEPIAATGDHEASDGYVPVVAS